jgi:DNA repair protein RecN (Recombination protein N)
MIKRVFIKELLSFDKVIVEFDKGLNVITGPSGAGKSVFINALLANFALTNQEAKLCEVTLLKPSFLESEKFDLDEDELVIKAIKKDRVRFFLNEQNISKKALKELFSDYISYISVRDKKGFENETLLNILDSFIIKRNSSHAKELEYFQALYKEYLQKSKELEEMKKRAKESHERLEFLKFEIEKIEAINPKEGEYEELLEIKRQLSKLDKINEILGEIEPIFEYEDKIAELFDMLNKDSSYLNDAFNQLRSDLEDIDSLKEELSEIDIEEVLNRLEELSTLLKRFGSIAEAKEYLDEKKQELESFEKIEENTKELEIFLQNRLEELEKKALEISTLRKEAAKEIEKELASYLEALKLPKIHFTFKRVKLSSFGIDSLDLNLEGSKIETLSGGEFNRVRLALLSVAAKEKAGVIILDEIDANVSGDESIAIANMISNLAKSYQVFAISHQAHLSAKANKHIFISKKDKKSKVEVLDKEQRVAEIARIVGGENYNEESLNFAKKLFEQ